MYVLTGAFPDAITTPDRRGRTPLHFALSNAGRRAAPAAVRLLVSFNRDIVNSRGGSSNPLRVLAEFASTIRNENDEQKDSVHKCLEHLLNAEPVPTADFFTALQSLPDWLSEQAVVMDVVQILLNEKISQRFPTFVLMLDFYVLMMVIVAYSINVITSIELRFENQWDESVDRHMDAGPLIPLYLGGGYFFMREVIQLISLLSLKAFNVWVYDPSNWLNLAFVILVLVWTILMNTGGGDLEMFKIGSALSVMVLWFKLLAYLRNVMIEFAVFVGGVFYVVNRLAAFLISLGIILIGFAQMFNTVYMDTPYCLHQPNAAKTKTELLDDLRCDDNEIRPWCDWWTSFLRVYTMLLGEVDENDFQESPVALALFILFMFLVVILLANVLIAIVTDSYKVIQDQRSAIVFWTNRLDFVAEMDAIANGPWKTKLKKALGFDDDDRPPGPSNASERKATEKIFGKESWKRLMDLFEDEIDDSVVSFEYFLYTLLRVAVAVIVIPLWIFVGIITAGWLWPPQIREAVFTSRTFKHSSDSEKEDELRKTQVKKLEVEVKELKDELVQELAQDRTQVVQMKSAVAERKIEIANEMKQVKRIVTMLFEQQAGFG